NPAIAPRLDERHRRQHRNFPRDFLTRPRSSRREETLTGFVFNESLLTSTTTEERGGIIVSGAPRQCFNATFLEQFCNREKSCLRIQRVEDGFDQQQIRAAVEQAANLFVIRRHEFIKRRAARG